MPLAILLAIVGTGTIVSLLPSTAWYIRIFDFLLELLLYTSFLAAMAALLAGKWRNALVGGFAFLAVIHLVRIWPYVVVAPNEIELGRPEGSECFSLLTLNVLQSNRDYARTLDLIRARDPDLILLTETDRKWLDALMPVLQNYPQRMAEPLDNTYGMIFATRLPVQSAAMPMDRVADAPTLYATVTIPDAGDFELIGLHPRPPKPGQDVERRDKMIAEAGMATPDGLEEALTLGDFNDVPWSQTTQAFRAHGGYGDPRAGRGTFPTFPSSAGKLGWPLDHIFVKGNLHIRSFAVLDDVGSDHRPLAADVCMIPESSD
ncbi:hypothetical protein GRI94_15750 [Erythrobacter jejuensis]|uniref:Endonuclease/exonuclease/phosphatase domain-containing protein n=1 Tax=Parerythrobacter jejuensis TaxID=795812 RepID=A0A845AQY5_9SPHN|nr:hypothetical protein [Parerythrobacter jejuensis]MXP33282.1 hypothetical protein [Parerythrobacter jejuensis]